MEKPQFLEMMEGILEVRPRKLTGVEQLSAFDTWDSIAILDYIATIDRTAGIVLDVEEIAGCKTFDELFTKLTQNLQRVPAQVHV
jgi:acyl carrier protein